MSSWDYIIIDDLKFKALEESNTPIKTNKFTTNQGVEVYSKGGRMLNCVYDANLKALRQINDYNPVFNNSPNREISIYNDLLINNEINTVIVDGIFGTGKTSTLCSHVVEGLKRSRNTSQGIEKVYISKPHQGLGSSYGYLPGDLMDKTKYEFMSYFQYFDRFYQPGYADILMSMDKLELVVFEYLRGRDLDSGWVVLDEAQNTSKKEMSSFLSRVGDGAKLVILGDTSKFQIDRRGNTVENNGLTFAKELLSGKKYCGVVELGNSSHILRGQRVKDLYKAMEEGSE